MAHDIGDAVAELLDRDVTAIHRLSGGDVSDAFRVDLGDGDRVFAKTHGDPPPHFFSTEATGLQWLRDSAEVSDAAVGVPRVLATADDLLVLEWIEQGPSIPSTDEDFGRALAAIHRVGAPTFGRTDRRTTGSRALPNAPCDSWSEFYASMRLEPLARLALDSGALSRTAVDRIRVLA
ncbi:fructosamine kinase family protein, partial [Ilumatobacter sp.]|uniref:fructosamine kinase family protein n=1 Tax=Ilumatobacter sp. TaxID=1967498 RepID=UPI003C541931